MCSLVRAIRTGSGGGQGRELPFEPEVNLIGTATNSATTVTFNHETAACTSRGTVAYQPKNRNTKCETLLRG